MGGICTATSKGRRLVDYACTAAWVEADTFRQCDNCPEMAVVPAGSFMMGSPPGEKDRAERDGPQHVVTINKPFSIAKPHVTIDQFAVRWVNWNDAKNMKRS
jgi:formylglycine-generating enzyme required for sulfatase activity